MQPLQICIGPTIHIGQESWCHPYAGFFLVVLENIYLEEIIGNGFTNFCMLDTNPFVLNLFTQNLFHGFQLCSKDQWFFLFNVKII